mgnify:CR=1 FL=1
MRVVDLIKSTDKTAFSFEILPPLKGTGIEKLYKTVDTLREFDPKYINITTHRSEYVYKDLGNGLYQRARMRRRPGTVAVAAALQNKYNITTVPHILCSGFTREDTEYVLLDLQFLGITDLLVLRGDKAKHESAFVPEGNGYSHALELEGQINDFNKGLFVDGSPIKVTGTPFSYGVACYPEKHEESPNMEQDIYWLKKKVEAGAEYAVTVRCAVGPVSRVGDEASPLVTVAAEKSGVLAGAELVLRIVKGGGLNTGTYQLSTDGGDNFERVRTIPVDGKLTLSDFGVSVTFPDGSYTAGTTYECRLLAPTPSIMDVMDALESPLALYLSLIHISEPTRP